MSVGGLVDGLVHNNPYPVHCVLLCCQICFWLLENGFRVMIAACDTFRSGAVEQLKTHLKHLSSLHPPSSGGPPKVCLCERGYGKDSAGLAMEAIHSGVCVCVCVCMCVCVCVCTYTWKDSYSAVH